MIINAMKRATGNSRLLRLLAYPAVLATRLLSSRRASIRDEILDNLADILAEDPIVMANGFQGRFVVGRRSDFLRRMATTKDYEPRLVQCCLDCVDRDRDAVDVGANIGFFTVLLAKQLRDRRVLAIEPTPDALARLHKNLTLNGIRDVTIVCEGAASDRLGYADLRVVLGREEYSSLGVMEHPSIAREDFATIKVASTTVDHLIDQHSLNPGFIKIDVEGMEHLVLHGMQGTLKDKRPVILSELCDPLLRKNGSSAQQVIEFVRSFGYAVVDPLFEKLPPGKRPFGDILCRPT